MTIQSMPTSEPTIPIRNIPPGTVGNRGGVGRMHIRRIRSDSVDVEIPVENIRFLYPFEILFSGFLIDLVSLF
jgi:hypothetical protein